MIAVVNRPQVINITSTSQEIVVVNRPQTVNVKLTIPIANFTPFTFTATQGQTIFTLTTTPLAVTSLYINGAGQNQAGGDFSVSGLNITLSQGVNSGDTVYGVIQIQ